MLKKNPSQNFRKIIPTLALKKFTIFTGNTCAGVSSK